MINGRCLGKPRFTIKTALKLMQSNLFLSDNRCSSFIYFSPQICVFLSLDGTLSEMRASYIGKNMHPNIWGTTNGSKFFPDIKMLLPKGTYSLLPRNPYGKGDLHYKIRITSLGRQDICHNDNPSSTLKTLKFPLANCPDLSISFHMHGETIKILFLRVSSRPIPPGLILKLWKSLDFCLVLWSILFPIFSKRSSLTSQCYIVSFRGDINV